MVRRLNSYAHSAGGVVALEEEQRRIDGATGTGDDVVVAPVENNAESAETEIIDIIEENNAADELIAKIEDGTDALIAVEGFIESMKLAVESGGYDKNAALGVQRSVAYAYKNAGFLDHSSVKAFPALESFGGTGTRVNATKLALEEAESRFKKIWQSILEAIKKAVAWIKDKFFQIFGAAEKLQKRAKAVAEKAKNSANATKSGDNIENERLIAGLFVGGSVPATADGLLSVVQQTADIVYTKISTADDSQIGVWVEKLGSLKSVDELEVAAMTPPGLDKVTDPAKEGLQVPPSGVTLYRSKELPGGKAVFARLVSAKVKGDAAAQAIRNMGGSVGKFSANVKAPEAKGVAVLPLGEIEKLGAGIDALMTTIIARRAVATELASLGDKLLAAANKASGEAEKDEPKVAAVKSQIATGLVTSLGHPAEDFTRYAVSEFAKSALDYAELSLKQYGKAPAAAAAPAAPAAGAKK